MKSGFISTTAVASLDSQTPLPFSLPGTLSARCLSASYPILHCNSVLTHCTASTTPCTITLTDSIILKSDRVKPPLPPVR